MAGHSANKVAAAGSHVTALRVEGANGRNISDVENLLGPLEVKTSRNPGQALSMQPTIESSLFTNVHLFKEAENEGGDESEAEAGVLGWIEVNGDATGGDDQLVTVNGELVDAQTEASDLIEGGEIQDSLIDVGPQQESLIASDYRTVVVAFATRAYRMRWTWKEPDDDDDDEVDDEEMEAHLRTRSANGFGWIAPLQGDNTVTFKGVGYVYTDDSDAEAVAFVGNRTMMMDPIKLHHDLQ